MIFVTVGSQKFQFDRLLKAVDALVADGTIQEDVFAQSGACTYIPQHFESSTFLDRDTFQARMASADIVITHGGTGAIVGALKAGKKVIAVPRLAKYGEHVDDHQLQLIEQFVQSGFIAKCENLEDLGETLKQIRNLTFGRYASNTDTYIMSISRYIDSL